MPAPPTLSVGMPVYNGGRWIGEALTSILGQSFRDFELVIADNASTDDTEAIARAAAAADARVRYVRNPVNIGVFGNYDRVLALSTGRYFKWAACSDICLDGFFAACIEVLEARPEVVLAYPKTRLFSSATGATEDYEDYLDLDVDGPAFRFSRYLNRVVLNNVMHGVMRTAVIRRTALNKPWPGSDVSMIAELCLHGRLVEVQARLFLRRMEPDTTVLLMDRPAAPALATAYRHEPGGRARIALHLYRFITTARAPIPFAEKVRVWLYLARRVAWLRHRAFDRARRLVTGGR